MTPEQIAKLIKENARDIQLLEIQSISMHSEVPVGVQIIIRQQQIIEFLIARENERQGDHK